MSVLGRRPRVGSGESRNPGPSTGPPHGAPWDLPFADAPFCFLDLETTGTDPQRSDICEIAIVRHEPRRGGPPEITRLDALVKPTHTAGSSTAIHGLTDDALATASPWPELVPAVRELLHGAVPVAHRAEFDIAFLRAALDLREEPPALCTLTLARRALNLSGHSLDALAQLVGGPRPTHRAMADVEALLGVWPTLVAAFRPATPRNLWEVRAGGTPLLRTDLERILASSLAQGRPVKLCYRVPGRAPREHVAEVRWLRPPHLEVRLDRPGAVRILRGDRILWAEPA